MHHNTTWEWQLSNGATRWQCTRKWNDVQERFYIFDNFLFFHLECDCACIVKEERHICSQASTGTQAQRKNLELYMLVLIISLFPALIFASKLRYMLEGDCTLTEIRQIQHAQPQVHYTTLYSPESKFLSQYQARYYNFHGCTRW